MIKIVDGDILNATENIICHQVNCMGVMGGGVALQLAKAYPEMYRGYKEDCGLQGGRLLGQVTLYRLAQFRYIANLFGQYSLGSGVQTNYGALGNAMLIVKNFSKKAEYSVTAPYLIGCGLAGGDWNLVYPMLEKIFDDYELTLYKLNP